MIVKHIRARVPDRAAFDRAQRRWGPQSGMITQLGGWSLQGDDDVAVVVALWEDDDAHRRFLAAGHDAVAERQRDTYTDLSVELFAVAADAAALTSSPPSSTVLRTARCTLRPGRGEHALAVQREVWFPAMGDAGMEHGLLGIREDTLLVLSLWPDRATHDAYQRDRVAALREEADVAVDMEGVDGDLVALEPGWRVGRYQQTGSAAGH